MKVQWNRVTWYSQIIAIVLFLGVFGLGMWLGMQVQRNVDAQSVVLH